MPRGTLGYQAINLREVKSEAIRGINPLALFNISSYGTGIARGGVARGVGLGSGPATGTYDGSTACSWVICGVILTLLE